MLKRLRLVSAHSRSRNPVPEGAITFLTPQGYRDHAKLDPEKLYVATFIAVRGDT
jgi:hypothetical protein